MDDPVMNDARIITLRCMLFLLLAFSVAAGLWYGILVELYHQAPSQLLMLAESAYQGRGLKENPTLAITFWFCVVCGISLTLNLYLYIAWRLRRSVYQHHRGVQLEDRRYGGRHV